MDLEDKDEDDLEREAMFVLHLLCFFWMVDTFLCLFFLPPLRLSLDGSDSTVVEALQVQKTQINVTPKKP